MNNYIEEEIFSEVSTLVNGEYEYCKFINCNLTMVELFETSFRAVIFKDCKMIGLKFNNCNEFALEFSFENCILNYSSFYKMEIPKTSFKNSQLHELDFTKCNLQGSLFDNCDLNMARFIDSNIEYVDFRTSYNYSIDLELNKIKKAKFSLIGLSGLLDKYDIDIK